MTCEHCGTQIPEGLLLCPKCGWEIQIVPDFESVIENTVTDVMDNIADHVARTQDEEELEIRTEQDERHNFRAHFYSTVIAFVIVLLLVVVGFRTFLASTPDKLLERADTAYGTGEYSACIRLYEEYLKDNPPQGRILTALADSYRRLDRDTEALEVYSGILEDEVNKDVASSNPDYESIWEEALRGSIEINIKLEDYIAANELLSMSEADGFRYEYPSYNAFAPEFSIPQDTYDQPLYLRLMDLNNGTIYYTLDGSEPDTTSDIYRNPILLEEGIYTVKACSVNPYGIMSNTITQIYEIQSMGEINVSPQSGFITEPGYVNVSAPPDCVVYYTTDGSTPTRDSARYQSPLAIPDGESTFRFLVVMEDTNIEEEISRHYNFFFEGEISREDAVNMLTYGLVKAGYLTDQSGVVFGSPGRYLYICSGVVSINASYYYLVIEYHEDEDGNQEKTGEMYCIDTDNGSLYRAVLDQGGHYSVVSL